MDRLRTNFTCLFFFSALLGIAIMLGSCQQSTNKQKPVTEVAAKPGQQDNNASVQNGTPAPAAVGQEPQQPSAQEKKLDHPVLLDRNYGKQPNSQKAKMLNAFAKNSPGTPGPVMKSDLTPDQKKGREFYLSGAKKAVDGDQKGAIEDFTESLNLYKVPNVYMKRGFSELVLEDYTSAQNDMNEAIKMNPKLERAYFGRAVCRFELKDFKTAEEDMKVFIEKDSTTAMAYNYLAGCRFMQQDYKGALENYDRVVKLDPKYPNIYTNRGMMRHYMNDMKGALEDYNKALEIDPDNATAYNNRGGATLNQLDFKGASEDFNKAISLKKDYADAYDNRGKARINLGDKTGACEDWQKSYSLGIEASRDMIIKYCKAK